MMTNLNPKLYRQRRWANAQGLVLSMTAMALGLTVLLWILFVLFSNGLAAIDWNMFTQDTCAMPSSAV
jgi:phosphate transport system permease protein